MTKDEILKRCEQWFAAYMHDRESHDEAAELLAAIRNGSAAEPTGEAAPCGYSTWTNGLGQSGKRMCDTHFNELRSAVRTT